MKISHSAGQEERNQTHHVSRKIATYNEQDLRAHGTGTEEIQKAVKQEMWDLVNRRSQEVSLPPEADLNYSWGKVRLFVIDNHRQLFVEVKLQVYC